jgi:hypothetical protein
MFKLRTIHIAIIVLLVVSVVANWVRRSEHFKVTYMTPGASGPVTVSRTNADGPKREIAEGRHISSLSVAKDWAVGSYDNPRCSGVPIKTYNEGNHTAVLNPVRCLFADNLKVQPNPTQPNPPKP